MRYGPSKLYKNIVFFIARKKEVFFMPFDLDMKTVAYLGMITTGIFFIEQFNPVYYLVIGFGLVAVGGVLVFRKSRTKELGTKL